MTAPTQTGGPDPQSRLLKVLGDTNSVELRRLLLDAGAAGPVEVYAAVDILIEAFGGLLLVVDGVRECIALDDGRAYIDWKALDQYAGQVRDGWKKPYPIGVPGVGVVLHVACALATGTLTPSSARLLAGSLAVAGRQQRPTDK